MNHNFWTVDKNMKVDSFHTFIFSSKYGSFQILIFSLHLISTIRQINPSNPKIKILVLICCPNSFPVELVVRSW